MKVEVFFMEKVLSMVIAFMVLFSNFSFSVKAEVVGDLEVFNGRVIIDVTFVTPPAVALRIMHEMENPDVNLPESYFAKQALEAHTTFWQQLEEELSPSEFEQIMILFKRHQLLNSMTLWVLADTVERIAALPEVKEVRQGLSFSPFPQPSPFPFMTPELNNLVNVSYKVGNMGFEWGISRPTPFKISSAAELANKFPHWQQFAAIYDENFFEDNFLIFIGILTITGDERRVVSIRDIGGLINIEEGRDFPVIYDGNGFLTEMISWNIVLEIDRSLLGRTFSIALPGQEPVIIQPPPCENCGDYDCDGVCEQVSTPTATPNNGTFTNSVNVTLSSATEGAAIFYTLDETEPTTASAEFTAPFTLTATTTVRAIAIKDGMANSEMLTVTFTRQTNQTNNNQVNNNRPGFSISRPSIMPPPTNNNNGNYNDTYNNVNERPEWQNPFTDVSESDWFYYYVQSAVENGLLNGVGNGEFAPNASATRGMFITVLWRLAGVPNGYSENSFTDVNGGWYSDAVDWAVENGVVNGVGNGYFAPNSEITREQMGIILYRYVGGLVDVVMDRNYAPLNTVTRAEIAAVMKRLFEN